MDIWTAEETRAALPFDQLVPALREMFRRGCEVPPRHVHALPQAGGTNSVLIMPAWQPDGLLGIKTVNVFPGNARHALPALHSLYTLFDATTGRPLAMLDGDEITSRRTAAASALAASYLAAPQARTLLVVGTGRVARLVAPAYRAALPIERVLVWGRDQARARGLVDELRRDGFDACAVGDLATAVARADIVSCATLATRPLVRGAWLRPDSHLDLIGGFTPRMREADLRCFVGARVFVDTREALAKSGDLLVPIRLGVLPAGEAAGDLAQLVRGDVPGRDGIAGRTVFKSVGTALEDLAAASLAYAAGFRGTPVS
jgi:ornithine cyclodeaminase